MNLKKQQKPQFEKRNSCQRLHFSSPIFCSPSVRSKKRILIHVCGIRDVKRELIYCMHLKYFPYVAWHNSLVHIIQINIILFSPWRNSPSWAKVSSLLKLHDHTQKTPLSLGLLWKSDQFNAETCTHRKQHSQATDIHAFGGIRNHNPSKRPAVDPRLRSRRPLVSAIINLASFKYTRF